jgi:hypothetical protein
LRHGVFGRDALAIRAYLRTGLHSTYDVCNGIVMDDYVWEREAG